MFGKFDVADRERGKEGFSCSTTTLFVDGISDFVDYFQIRSLFGHIRSLVNVFVQKQRRLGRACRFGFVRYSSVELASSAINLLNGVLVGGSILSVALAKFPKSGSARSFAAEVFPMPLPVKVGRAVAPSVDELRMISELSRDSPCSGWPAMLLFPETIVSGFLGGSASGEEERVSCEALFPELGIGDLVSAGEVILDDFCSLPSPVCAGAGVVPAGCEVGSVSERRRRGRPRKGVAAGNQKVKGVLVDEVVVQPVVEESSLILPEACGSARALTRARRDFLIAKQVGVVPIGPEEEAILSFADHLIATHPRLYGDP